jgi:ferredoxin
MPLRFRHGEGRGFGRRHGLNPADSADPNCICPACNTVVAHQRGNPCFETACPKCGAKMTRQFRFGTGEVVKPVVNPKFCTGCGNCLRVCAFEAIKIIEVKAVIDPTICTNCRACISSCPVLAIH